MLNNGCVPSESGPTEVTADFRFTRVMAEQAARAIMTTDTFAKGAYTSGDVPGEGKALSSTTFSPACRSPPGGGSIFITSSANCTSG